MKLLLIDGNSVLNRAFYGIRPLSTKSGIHTNGVYGFMNILFRLLDDLSPDSVCVAFDVRQPTFRHQLYSEYKAGRKPSPPELTAQFPVLKELLDAFGIQHRELAGYEADDIIGTLSACCGCECFIATGDRDAFQLIGDKVSVLLASTRAGAPETVLYNPAKIAEVYGVSPKQLRDVKGLMGDQSDHIPGVRGVGEKTACELIRSYSSLEGVYDNLPQLRDTLRAKLEADRDSAFLSHTLAEICLTVPIETDAAVYAVRPYDSAELAAAFTKYELVKFIDRFSLNADAAAVSVLPPLTLADTETVGTEALAAVLSGLSRADIYFSPDSGEVILCGERTLVCSDTAGALKALSGFRGRVRVNDYKRLCRAMLSAGLEPPAPELCLSLGGYLLNPDRSDYSVFALARHYSLPRPAAEDAASAASLLSALCDRMTVELEAEGLMKLLTDIELPLARVLTRTELVGFLVDTDGLREFGGELSQRLDALRERIFVLAGCEFNINSPKQLGDVLFVRLGIRNGRRTKSGFSTDAEVLGKLKNEYEIVELVLEYRKVAKLISTYVDGLTAAAGPDGRIHTTFIQTETRTGRISSREPNLQNIPVRTELGSRMRRYFTAAEGCLLVDADYSQIELRILASVAGDENMIAAFIGGGDFHTRTAARVFGLPPEEVTPMIRSRAKAVNFGIVYGMGAFSLSQELKISVGEAKKYIESYFDTYPAVRSWLDSRISCAKETGYARTALGRRRRLESINGKNANIRNFEERVAMNMPIQGTAADIIKLAMVNADKRFEAEGMKTRLILQVHDELIAEAPEEEAETAARLLREEMENAYRLSVPLSVEVGIGKTWYDAK